MRSAASLSSRVNGTPPFVEFIALIALMMAMVALSIDNLLPAFVPIQREFNLTDPNETQFLISTYMAGFALSQILYGPLSDAIGRRPSLIIGMVIYTAGTILAIFARSFEILLIARVIQGIGGAASRVLVTTIVRDRYEGQEMARVMSFVMMVFIIGPIIAPGSGALFLMFGSWRLIFVSMLVLGLLVLIWFSMRMPETLQPEDRLAPSLRVIMQGMRECITNRTTLGYTLANSVVMGTLMGYINSSQQIFETDVYALGSWFPVIFGIIAAVIGIASLVNAMLVRRVGLRRLSHISIIAFACVAFVQVFVAWIYQGHPPLIIFCIILASLNFIFSLAAPNFNALAMGPMGKIAGTASSFTGAVTTALSAVFGLIVGQAYDGTVLPLAVGYAVLGTVAVGAVYWTEKDLMFREL